MLLTLKNSRKSKCYIEMIQNLNNLVFESLSCTNKFQVYRRKAGKLTHRGPLLPNMVVVARAKKAFPIWITLALFSYHQHDITECAYQPKIYIQIKLTNSNLLTTQTILSQTQLKPNNLHYTVPTKHYTVPRKRNNARKIKGIKTISIKITSISMQSLYYPNQLYFSS